MRRIAYSGKKINFGFYPIILLPISIFLYFMKGEFRERLMKYPGTLIIGVAGDSGSGKSTFTKGITNLLGKDMVSYITLDDYHTEDRETRKKTGHLPLDPKINNLELAGHHLKELRKGKAIIKPVYNHKTGKFDAPQIVEPKKILIVEGLHTLYDDLRNYIDLSIFVEPSREIKYKWKIKRDVEERGYKEEDVLKEIRIREPYYKRYIDFQKVYADVVIKIRPSEFYEEDSYYVELIMKKLDFPLSGIKMSFSISSVLNTSKMPFAMKYRDDFYYQKNVSRIAFDGKIPRESIESIEKKIIEYTGFTENYLLERRSYINGIQLAQLMVCWYFVEMMNNIFRELERAAF